MTFIVTIRGQNFGKSVTLYVMQYRNPITKLTSFWYVPLIRFRCMCTIRSLAHEGRERDNLKIYSTYGFIANIYKNKSIHSPSPH